MTRLQNSSVETLLPFHGLLRFLIMFNAEVYFQGVPCFICVFGVFVLDPPGPFAQVSVLDDLSGTEAKASWLFKATLSPSEGMKAVNLTDKVSPDGE